MADDATRIETVRVQADLWADQLIDLGSRNTLLYYRDTRTSTLDLTQADPDALVKVLSGRQVRLRELVTDDEYADACSRVRNLRKKVLHLAEEQGIDAGYLAYGLVRMTSPGAGKGRTSAPSLRAPLLLRALDLRAKNASESDFSVKAVEGAVVNPVLIYALSRHYGLDLDAGALGEKLNALVSELTDPAEQAGRVFDELVTAMGPHAAVASLDERVLVGVFSFEKLPMVNDLHGSTELLASHDVIAALAGYAPAEVALNAAGDGSTRQVDAVAPREEFLVQDADSSQQASINAVLAGRHVVIEGPPGTGKSQTIANIIAALAARGERVLFVSEKRAAIEAVVDRLAMVDLDGLVLDLHDRRLNPRQVAQQLAETLRRASAEPPPDLGDLHDRLRDRWSRAATHPAELHEAREPWGLSAYEAQSRLLALLGDEYSQAGVRLRFRGPMLRDLAGPVLDAVETDLKNFVDLGGVRVRLGQSPWSRSAVRNLDEVEGVQVQLDRLAGGGLRQAQSALETLIAATGLRRPAELAGWQDVLNLLGGVEGTLAAFGPDVFGGDLDDLRYATADRTWRSRNRRDLGFWRRRALRTRARRMHRAGARDRRVLFGALDVAVQQRDLWQVCSLDGTGPRSISGLEQAMNGYAEMRNQLAAVSACASLDGLEQRPTEEVAATLDELAADEATLFRMPELNGLIDRLQARGLGNLLDEVSQHALDSDQAVRIFRRVWLTSLVDEFRLRIPHLASFTGQQQSRIVAEFCDADTEHMRVNASRVRRRVATRLREARDAHPDQSAVVRDQAAKSSRHLPLRKLVEKAPDVMLAARPCWAMSPLVVSQVLPAERLFDVVVFDEASQVEPQDAMTSIMRGRRLVVAGDDKQLPPSTFFRRVLRGDADLDDNEDAEGAADLLAYDSILDVMKRALPHAHMLNWHYRSQDERLIAFSNKEIYDGKLVTFPGVLETSPLRLKVVDGVVSPGQAGSAPQEVEEVVRLVMEHAEHRPDESLGVIAMSQAHASRIEMALSAARRDRPELDDFFSEDRGPGKRFFVKNLERVQGDERDVIILSIGYAKAASGRLPMRFGPVNNAGGERRLNVAITRARRRMTIVSSFSHLDMDPSATATATNRGPELLRRLLEFASLGGGRMPDQGLTGIELNGFEHSVYEALCRAGLPVHPQWGVAGYRIDFALAHPEQRGRMILAVETDGERYHRGQSARDRDRLRESHLRRLGWRFHRLWSTEWLTDPAGETARIVQAWEQAIAGSDGQVSAPEPPVTSAPRAISRGPRPRVPSGVQITSLSDRQLVAICSWLLRDQLQVDRQGRIAQAMAELGFRRRGQVILERLNHAFDVAQSRTDSEEF